MGTIAVKFTDTDETREINAVPTPTDAFWCLWCGIEEVPTEVPGYIIETDGAEHWWARPKADQ